MHAQKHIYLDLHTHLHIHTYMYMYATYRGNVIPRCCESGDMGSSEVTRECVRASVV
jgi:hypothetical protein